MKLTNQPQIYRGGGYSSRENPVSLKQNAFTLIELLVVIAIIGILATVVIASLNSARAKARDARRISDVRQVQTALEMYYADNGIYPQAVYPSGCFADSWETPLSVLVSGGYIASLPEYPQKTSTGCYHYAAQINNHTSVFLCNGITRGAYQYSIFFVMEGSHPFGIPSGGINPSTFNACVVGPAK